MHWLNSANGFYLYMVEEDNRLADSTIVVNGQFQFEGEILRPCWACIRDSIMGEPAFIVLESGTINLLLNESNFRCEGTPTNNTFQKGWQAFNSLNQERLKNYEAIDTMNVDKGKKKELFLKYRSDSEKLTEIFVKENVSKNLDNIIPSFWLRLFNQLFSTDEINTMLANASPVLKENSFMKKIMNVQSGKHYVDIDIENHEGEKIKLSEVLGKGNYILINVWASWCGGCIAELPQIQIAGEKYRDKGLKIIGLSIDRSKDAWKNALNRLNLPWQQFHVDYSFINTYGINQIPVLILIDPDGIIMKRNFRIEELEHLLVYKE